jgi:hypothetical protein
LLPAVLPAGKMRVLGALMDAILQVRRCPLCLP